MTAIVAVVASTSHTHTGIARPSGAQCLWSRTAPRSANLYNNNAKPTCRTSESSILIGNPFCSAIRSLTACCSVCGTSSPRPIRPQFIKKTSSDPHTGTGTDTDTDTHLRLPKRAYNICLAPTPRESESECQRALLSPCYAGCRLARSALREHPARESESTLTRYWLALVWLPAARSVQFNLKHC